MEHTNTDMILSNFIHDSQFTNVVLPNISEKYMTIGPTDVVSEPHKFIFNVIKDQYLKNNSIPSLDALSILMTQNMKVIKDIELKDSVFDIFNKMKDHICSDDSLEFRIDQAQNHCQTVESQLALMKSAELLDKIDSGDTDRGRHEIIDIMGKVFDINFKPNLGSELGEDIEGFYDRLSDVHEIIPFGIRALDHALAGGLKRNGLTIIIGSTNVGKTALMTDFTSRFISSGRNVLYISKEISSDEIKERIFANILNLPTSVMKDSTKTPKASFVKRVNNVLSTCGKVFIKHDNSNSFNSEDVKLIVQGLEKKNNLKFDIVVVDNLSNLSPITMKRSGNVRGDEILVEVAKELRNLSFVIDAHIIAPEQATFEAMNKLQPDLSDIANAKGISRVVDNAIVIGSNDEFKEANMLMLTIRKTRSKDSNGRQIRLGYNWDIQKTHEIDEDSDIQADNNVTLPVKESKVTINTLRSTRMASRDAKNASRSPLLSI